ncbi:unnamed protein product [Rhodiola kirilowii]
MVKISRTLLKNAEVGISRGLLEILVCPISKQPLRHCEETGTLISDTIGVSFPIVDGIPCLVPHDGKILDNGDEDITAEADGSTEPSIMEKKESWLHILYQILSYRKVHQVSEYRLSRSHFVSSGGSKFEQDLREEIQEDDVDNRTVCCVCLSRVVDGQERRALPCKHDFHKECVNSWFDKGRKTCPVCRFSMEGREEDEELSEEMVTWFSSFHIAGF